MMHNKLLMLHYAANIHVYWVHGVIYLRNCTVTGTQVYGLGTECEVD